MHPTFSSHNGSVLHSTGWDTVTCVVPLSSCWDRNCFLSHRLSFILWIPLCHTRGRSHWEISSSRPLTWMAACVFCVHTHIVYTLSASTASFSQDPGMFGVTMPNWFSAQQTADCEPFFPLCSRSQDAPPTVIWVMCRLTADDCRRPRAVWVVFSAQERNCPNKCCCVQRSQLDSRLW